MSYTHRLVSDITHAFDDVQATGHLKNFVNALHRSIPGIKVGVSLGCRTSLDMAYREAYLYFEGQQYALCKIGYGDYSVKRNSESGYMMSARSVKNGKYNESSKQYAILMSKDVEKAVRNVKKHLRPYTVYEMADMSNSSALYYMSEQVSERRRAAYDAWGAVSSHDDLKAELLTLYETGYVFTSSALREKVGEWVAAAGTHKHGLQHGRWMTFVQVFERHGEQHLNIMHVPNMASYAQTRQAPVTIKAAEAEEWIVGRLAVLSMADTNTYVEGVGFKVDMSTFWVEK